MQLGAPLIEAKLRKREFQRQQIVAQQEREFRASEAEADRALRRQGLEQEQKQFDRRLTQDQSQFDASAKAAVAALDKKIASDEKMTTLSIGAAKDRQSEQIAAQAREGAVQRGHDAAMAVSRASDQKEAIQIQAQNELRLQQMRIEAQKQESPYYQMRTFLEETARERADLMSIVNGPDTVIKPEARRSAAIKLEALDSSLHLMGQAKDMAINSGNIDSLNKMFDWFGTQKATGVEGPAPAPYTFGSIFTPATKPTSRLQVVSQPGEDPLIVDPASATGIPVQIQGRQTYASPIMPPAMALPLKGPDGRLMLPSGGNPNNDWLFNP